MLEARIKARHREIPAGLAGEIRRTVAGARFDIDHRHDELEFDLVVRGSGSMILDEESYVLKPGTLIWLLPGKRHRLVRSPNLEMWVVSARPGVLETRGLEELAAQPSCLLAGHDLVDLDGLLSQIAQDSDAPAIYNAGIAYLMLRAWRASRESPSAHIRPMHPAVSRALLLLKESGAAISLSELAKQSGVTAPYLSRLLIEHTARSFVEWRNRIRLERFLGAYKPGDNLLAAAHRAGFGSYARFHHVFNEIVGCGPSEWVRQGADDGKPAMDVVAPQGYGLPEAAALSTRQRWTHLLPFVASALPAELGSDLSTRLLALPEARERSKSIGHDHLDPGFGPSERSRLVGMLHGKDAALAAELAHLMELVDFADTYRGLVGVYGLSPTGLAEALAAFAAAAFVAATRGGDPGLEQLGGVLRQARRALAAMPAPLSRGKAQAAMTALIAAVVVAYYALQATRAAGDPRGFDELAEAACHAWRESLGGDAARLALTGDGFVRRPKSGQAHAKPRHRAVAKVHAR